MLRVCATILLLLAGLAASACGPLGRSSPRDLGERFADALEGRSDAAFETYLTADAAIYLQGSAAPITSQTLREYINGMKTNKQQFHRDGPVYVTPNGVGWLLAITRGSSEAAPTLWLEASISSGQISRVWIHFTYETLQALHHPPSAYIADMSKLGLPLPESWADGTPAMIAAAERYDPQAGGPRVPWQPILAIGALGCGAGPLLLLKATRRHKQVATYALAACNGALLDAVRMRRSGAATGTAIPVQGLSNRVAGGETG